MGKTPLLGVVGNVEQKQLNLIGLSLGGIGGERGGGGGGALPECVQRGKECVCCV